MPVRLRQPSTATLASRLLLRAADRVRLGMVRARGAISRFVPTAVGNIHVLDVAGSGELPTIVLLHGLSSCAADYGKLIRHLRPHARRILAFDLPGHGCSEPPRAGVSANACIDAIGDALATLCDEPAFVFGNSLGGLTAIRVAQRKPHLVAGLFLASPAGAPAEGDMPTLLATLRVRDFESARSFVRRAMPAAGWTTDFLAWGVQTRLGRPELQGMLHQARDLSLRASDLSSLTVPIHLFWGQREWLLPASHLRFFREHLPSHARFETPQWFGHVPFVEDPAAIARRIRAFAENVLHGPRPADSAISSAA